MAGMVAATVEIRSAGRGAFGVARLAALKEEAGRSFRARRLVLETIPQAFHPDVVWSARICSANAIQSLRAGSLLAILPMNRHADRALASCQIDTALSRRTGTAFTRRHAGSVFFASATVVPFRATDGFVNLTWATAESLAGEAFRTALLWAFRYAVTKLSLQANAS